MQNTIFKRVTDQEDEKYQAFGYLKQEDIYFSWFDI